MTTGETRAILYMDDRGWKYKVMSVIGQSSYKGRYQKPDKADDISGWKGIAALPWRSTFAEAQADLDRMAQQKGWAILHEQSKTVE